MSCKQDERGQCFAAIPFDDTTVSIPCLHNPRKLRAFTKSLPISTHATVIAEFPLIPRHVDTFPQPVVRACTLFTHLGSTARFDGLTGAEAALLLLEEMKMVADSTASPDIFTYTTVISGVVRAEVRLFDFVKGVGYKPVSIKGRGCTGRCVAGWNSSSVVEHSTDSSFYFLPP